MLEEKKHYEDTWVVPGVATKRAGTRIHSPNISLDDFTFKLSISIPLTPDSEPILYAESIVVLRQSKVHIQFIVPGTDGKSVYINARFICSRAKGQIGMGIPMSQLLTEPGILSEEGDLLLIYAISYSPAETIPLSTLVQRSIRPSTGRPCGPSLLPNPIKDRSKETTGYVGLLNQGVTCYMNSVLQMFFHIPMFRNAVYRAPVSESDDNSPLLNLQRLFCCMQLSEKAVSTVDFTRSFGWGPTNAFSQHDIRDFYHAILNFVDSSLQDDCVSDLFRGTIRSYVRCKNVPFESLREESFFDIELGVKGSNNLQESLEKYIEPELLTGDNQYRTEEFGPQDAEIGTEIAHLPKILRFHLRRFDFDFRLNQQVKISDYFEYPMTIDMGKFTVDGTETIYELFGVIVHNGTVRGGHCHAFLRTNPNPQWYQFNDASVTPASIDSVVEDNFGGPSNGMYGGNKFYSAYILMYMRQDSVDPVYTDEPIVPQHLLDYYEQVRNGN